MSPVREALAARDDAACASLIAQCKGELLPVRFEELAAADLPAAAVALAQLETGLTDLREAEATDNGGSYLHAAARAGAGKAVLSALVATGCALDGHDDEGNTALHVAARAGHLSTISALVAAGIDVLARNNMGRTARGQGGLIDEVRDLLDKAEEPARASKAAQQERLWGSKVKATQTGSAFRTGCA